MYVKISYTFHMILAKLEDHSLCWQNSLLCSQYAHPKKGNFDVRISNFLRIQRSYFSLEYALRKFWKLLQYHCETLDNFFVRSLPFEQRNDKWWMHIFVVTQVPNQGKTASYFGEFESSERTGLIFVASLDFTENLGSRVWPTKIVVCKSIMITASCFYNA